jgi:hypothetical protein
MTGFLAGDYAHSKGWDCFKDGYPGFSSDVNNFRVIWNSHTDKVTAERDEARRNLCDLYVKGQPSASSMTSHDYANELGWDCFGRPKTEQQMAMDRLAELDEELGLQ